MLTKRQSKNFQRFHNRHHRYSCLGGKTPDQVCREAESVPVLLAPNTKLPKLEYIPEGNIILIRFIRSNLKLDIFGEQFTVSKDLFYGYPQSQDKKTSKLSFIQVPLFTFLSSAFSRGESGQAPSNRRGLPAFP